MSHVRDADVLQRIAKSFSTGNLSLDERSWEIVKSQALQKARLVRESAAKAASDVRCLDRAASHGRIRDAAGSPALHAVRWASLDRGPLAPILARILICLYFINLVYDDYLGWKFLQSPDMQARIRLNPDRWPAAKFPTFKVFVVLPCTLLVAMGVRARLAVLLLPVQLFQSSWRIIWNQLVAWLSADWTVDELPVKKLAVGGAIFLLLACTTRSGKRMNSYAGLLVLEEQQRLSARKSALLLVCRLLMCSLFVFLGVTQASRVVERDVLFWRTRRWNAHDGHDNNWLLLELLLTVPFALGFKTQTVSRLLGVVLMLEAFTCWPFWALTYPTWHYAAHVRSHFFTNLAVSGGLLLLQACGAGSFSLDAIMRKRKAS